jgi:hypothetical protein
VIQSQLRPFGGCMPIVPERTLAVVRSSFVARLRARLETQRTDGFVR